jgi:hypothetical protein
MGEVITLLNSAWEGWQVSHPDGVWERDALVGELLGSLVVPLSYLGQGIYDEVQQFGVGVLLTGIHHVNPARVADYLSFTPLVECVKHGRSPSWPPWLPWGGTWFRVLVAKNGTSGIVTTSSHPCSWNREEFESSLNEFGFESVFRTLKDTYCRKL